MTYGPDYEHEDKEREWLEQPWEENEPRDDEQPAHTRPDGSTDA